MSEKTKDRIREEGQNTDSKMIAVERRLENLECKIDNILYIVRRNYDNLQEIKRTFEEIMQDFHIDDTNQLLRQEEQVIQFREERRILKRKLSEQNDNDTCSTSR